MPPKSSETITFHVSLASSVPVSKAAPMLAFEAYLDQVNSADGSGTTLADTYATDMKVPDGGLLEHPYLCADRHRGARCRARDRGHGRVDQAQASAPRAKTRSGNAMIVQPKTVHPITVHPITVRGGATSSGRAKQLGFPTSAARGGA